MASWPCMVDPSAMKHAVPKENARSFADVLHNSCEVQLSQLPCPAIRGDS
ncbi:hypothetical protein A2U01_0099252, partial [Trifolium medium]|nr:hypothetical protein [Trifolium medium]